MNRSQDISSFIISFGDCIEQLNYQKNILHPAVIEKAIERIKSELTTQQIFDLINGIADTQQMIAEATLTHIQHALQDIKETHPSSTIPSFINDTICYSDNDNHNHNHTIQEGVMMDVSLDDESTVSNVSFHNLTLDLELELTQTQHNDIPTTISPQQIFESAQLSQCLLDFMDDISIGIYAQINRKCNHIAQNVNQYILIKHNHWFCKYVSNHQYAVKHMVHCAEIVFDFTHFDTEMEREHDFLIKTFDQMRQHNIFENCYTLVIISPSSLMARVLSQYVGPLNCVTAVIFKDIEIFPMIKVISQIPSEDNSLIWLSMKDVHIKRDEELNADLYTENDDWMTQNINVECVQMFTDRLLECHYIDVSRWRNQHNFWNSYLGSIYDTFSCSNYNKLSEAMKRSLMMCPIKEVTYLPIAPLEDRIPFIWFTFMLQHKGDAIQKLKVHFGDSTKLYRSVFSKKLKKELEMSALRELYFGWSDRESYKLLYCIMNGSNLDTVKLWVPTFRTLSKQEEKMIAALKRKCLDVQQFKEKMTMM